MKLKLLLLILISSASIAMQKEDDPQAPIHQEWNANKFHRATKPSLPLAKQWLQRLTFGKITSVVDVGCGPGALTAFIAKKAPHAQVIGIDPSDTMIRLACVLNGKHKNLHFMQEDMSTTALNGPIDLFFSCNAIHLLPKEKQKEALKAMARLSNQNNGLLFAIMAAKTSKPSVFEKAYAATISQGKWKKLQTINLDDYFQPHNEHTFAELARDTGFNICNAYIVDEYIIFKNVNKLKKFITSWMGGFGFIAALPKNEQKQLIEAILKEYIKEVQIEYDGSIEWKSPRLVVLAERSKN